jgi:hypothetical protein
MSGYISQGHRFLLFCSQLWIVGDQEVLQIGTCGSVMISLSAVSEAPTSGKVSAKVLWTGASDTAT